HTRSKRDWSSDVCSSDLYIVEKRFNLSWSIEGTRSRTGKMLQTELGRQHLSGTRPGAFDRPAEVEPLLDDVADELSQHVLVERRSGGRRAGKESRGR